MRPETASVRQLVKEIDADSADWIPDPALDYIIDSVMAGQDPERVIAESHSQDNENAPFISLEILTQIVAIILAIKETWDFVTFADKATELLLDPNRKLEVATKVVTRLKQAGLTVPADRVQRWIDYVLERTTRPRTN